MMNKWIKSIICGLFLVGIFTVSGCGSNETKTPSAPQNSAHLLEKIKERGILVVGTASGYPPYEFVDTSVAEKKIVGVDIELAQKIADELGVKLEVQDMNFQALLSSLGSGKVDIAIAGMNETAERKKSIDFSHGYLPTHAKILIKKSDVALYPELSSFEGKPIGVQKSSIQENLVKQKMKKSQIIALAHVPDVIMELKHGKVACVVTDSLIGGQYLLFNDDLMLSSIDLGEEALLSAVAIPKGNKEFLTVVNKVIDEETENGNIEKWKTYYNQKVVDNVMKK